MPPSPQILFNPVHASHNWFGFGESALRSVAVGETSTVTETLSHCRFPGAANAKS